MAKCNPPGRAVKLKISWRQVLSNSLLILLLYLTSGVNCKEFLICSGHNRSVITYPEGDITIEYGNPLEVYCRTTEDYKWSDLTFTVGGVPVQDVVKVNNTAIKLYVPKPERQQLMYYCQNKEVKDSCNNWIVVDTPPLPVTDFKCRSHNLESLVCKWTVPPQVLKINYSLTFYINNHTMPSCNVTSAGNNRSCVWTLRTTPIYKTQKKFYKFNLTSTNVFKSISQIIDFDHYANLIPSMPVDLTYQVSTNSVLLRWKLPIPLLNFSPGVEHKIEYQIGKLPGWRSVNTSSLPPRNATYRFRISDLPYAYVPYDVRVYIKCIKAKDEEEFWSPPAFKIIRTPSERPRRPPAVAAGGFVVPVKRNTEGRDVRVYWQQLELYEENGPNFTYHVAYSQNNNIHNVNSEDLDSPNYVVIQNATFGPLDVWVNSFNQEGSSRENSHVYIPAENDRLQGPTSFTTQIFGNGTYLISWNPVPFDVDNYTIFWCKYKLPDACEDMINFDTLEPKKTSYTKVFPTQMTYQFAISANWGLKASGMVWAKCTMSPNATNTKITNLKVVHTSKNYVILEWDLDCSYQKGDILGYNITYKLVKWQQAQLKVNSVKIDDADQRNATIPGLSPYTTYSFTMAVIFRNGQGDNGIEVGTTTLQDAPSEPINVAIDNVTNTSMVVSWDPPKDRNGPILKYIIHFNNNFTEVTSPKENDTKRRSKTLDSLDSFTNYSISMQACQASSSEFCSRHSGNIILRTAIGPPGDIPQPYFNRSKTVMLAWALPYPPGGTVDKYHIRKNVSGGTPVEYLDVKNQYFEVDLCTSETVGPVSFEVRAVNMDADTYHGAFVYQGESFVSLNERIHPKEIEYLGPWSKPIGHDCTPTPNKSLWIVGCLMILILVVAVALGSKKLWIKIRDMRDVPIFLPPGIDTKKDPNTYLPNTWSPTTKVKEEKKSPSDQVHLLHNKEGGIVPGAKMELASDRSDSTTISLTGDQDAPTSDDSSNSSSLSLKDTPSKPTIMQTKPEDDDNSSHCSENEKYFDNGPRKDLPAGYIQAIGLEPVQVTVPPAVMFSGYVPAMPSAPTGPPAIPAPISPAVPPGYIRAQSAAGMPNVVPGNPTFMSQQLTPVFLPAPMVGNKLAPAEDVVSQLRHIESLIPSNDECRRLAPTKPQSSGGYVTHDNAIINKHLNMLSGDQRSEEPAILAPSMSPEAYSRFAWSADPTCDNLGLLLADTRVDTDALNE